eukprot:3370129-Rhodomonas_salina.1
MIFPPYEVAFRLSGPGSKGSVTDWDSGSTLLTSFSGQHTASRGLSHKLSRRPRTAQQDRRPRRDVALERSKLLVEIPDC